jgi:hypothetical protein
MSHTYLTSPRGGSWIGSVVRGSGRHGRAEPWRASAIRCAPARSGDLQDEPLACSAGADLATRRPDPEALAAIRGHWATWHLSWIAGEEIAHVRPGRIAEVTKAIVAPETRESPAWFTCLACPEGARRYRTDVGAGPTNPPSRHIAAITRHFRTAHGVRRLARERIYGGSDLPALATYGPSTPLEGAYVICGLCPEGNNRVPIEDPPYGDARSFSQLKILYPDLAAELVGLDPIACAKRLEAHHRAVVIPTAIRPATEWTLKRAQRPQPLDDGPRADR